MKKILILLMLSTLAACAYVDPAITKQSTVYYDSPVRKSALQVSVHPKGRQNRPLRAYFHPFVIQQQNSDYYHLSYAFAQIFANVWTEERLFPVQEMQSGIRYQGLNHALSLARARQADLLLLGSVPYFFAGHTLDDTAITIQMNIYDVASGNLIWTMMQSGRIEEQEPNDFIYFRQEYRLSDSPFNKIIRDIAKDMAVPLKAWLPSPDADYAFASDQEAIMAQLAGPPQPAPGMTGEQQAPNTPGAQNAASTPKPDGIQHKDGMKESTIVERPSFKGVNLNINFDTGKATINPKSYPQLDALGEALNSDELKGKSIIIAGHTDDVGSAQQNLTLSKARAEAVKDYLVTRWDISPDTLEAIGYGQSRPLETGTSPEARAKNRRVEVRLAE